MGNLKKNHNQHGLTPEPPVRSCDTSQWIPCLTAINWPQHGCGIWGFGLPHQLEIWHSTLIPLLCRPTDRWTYHHVITKISLMDRLPNFLSNEALLVHTKPAHWALLSTKVTEPKLYNLLVVCWVACGGQPFWLAVHRIHSEVQDPQGN